jgi:site-specific DNA-methyltransferase (adenine-specific)
MIYAKNAAIMNNHHPRYIDAFEYMFVLSKGVPCVFNPIKRKNKTVGQSSGAGKRQRNGNIETFGNERTETGKYSTEWNIGRIHSGGGQSSSDPLAYSHPAIFPEALARDHIISWSNPGDLVLDPFVGSGTTPKMAVKTDRHYIGIDLSDKYCELARKRVAMVKQQPKLFTWNLEPAV